MHALLTAEARFKQTARTHRQGLGGPRAPSGKALPPLPIAFARALAVPVAAASAFAWAAAPLAFASRGHRRGLGGPKGALWPSSSALAQALGLSPSFAGTSCLGLCLGSNPLGLCLRRHAGTPSQRAIGDHTEGSG